MAEKGLSLTILFDIYGGLLSANEKDAFEYYYCDDLSLSEIAEIMKMTRQGVRDNIVRAEKLLRESDMTLEKIADRCGFADADYFSRVFRRRYGTGGGISGQ